MLTPPIQLPECFVKSAVPEDAIALYNLLSQAFPETTDTPSSIFSRLFSGESLGIEVVTKQNILGFVEMKIQNGRIYIFNLAVAPEARSNGIATLLLKQVESLALFFGNHLFLHADPKQELLQFYEKRGFNFTGVDGLGDRIGFRMEKILVV